MSRYESKLPDSVAEAVELADKFVKMVSNQSTQTAINAALAVISLKGAIVVSILVNLMKCHEEVNISKMEWNALRAVADLLKRTMTLRCEKSGMKGKMRKRHERHRHRGAR